MTATEVTIKRYTLIFVHDKANARLLLGMKRRGFGAGRYNGFGGKVEASETPQQGAERELFEEAGITARLTQIACIVFEFDDKPGVRATPRFVL